VSDAAVGVVDADGVSTLRYQELYSRAARHLVRITASRVDALGNHTSPFGMTSTICQYCLAFFIIYSSLSLVAGGTNYL